MNKEQYTALKMPFENVLTKPGKGDYKYVPANDIIGRMNDVFQGKWSTEIVTREIVEDQILLHVRVTVHDSDNPVTVYYHDGFASQPVQRFSYGDNKGKPVDLGNSYTAALSKALKQACKKWGVALNIDEESEDTTTFISSSSAPITDKVVLIPSTKTIPTQPEETPIRPMGTNEPVSAVGTIDPTPTMPNIPITEKPAIKMPSPPITTPKLPGMPKPVDSLIPNMPTQPKQPTTVVSMDTVTSPGFMGSVGSTQEGKISEVQKAALNGVLSLKTANKTPEEVHAFYEQMAKDAFAEKGITKANIPAIDDLDYDDAVIVVKYGNELLRGTR